MKEFQSLLFSPELDIQAIKADINELKNQFSIKEIDYQIILAFSLNYEKIALLLPLLSESTIEERFFIHNDQILLFHLLKNNASFPLNKMLKTRVLEKSLYEELQKQNKLDILKNRIEIREKEKIEEIIDKDDIESFRLISNDINFDFNGRIKKENKLFKYTEIPIILYCIEKNAIKCFKYALINGANPSLKSQYIKDSFYIGKEIWDGYGFAGAIGNIQLIKMIDDQGIPINGNLIIGATKFHQNHIIHWAEKEHKDLLKDGLKACIQFQNYEIFEIIAQNVDNISTISYGNHNMTPLLYAAKYTSKELVDILIRKGADINAKDIIYKIIV